MKKIVLFMTLLTLVAACRQQARSPEEINKQIAEYQFQIKELQGKINTLKKQLTDTVSQDESSLLVGVMTMKFHPFRKYVEVTGNVVSDLQALVSPQINGQIKAIYVHEGDYVKKGDLLLTLNSDITDKSIEEVQTALELANTVYKKQKELWDQKIGSEIQYLQAKNRKESLEKKLETLQTQKEMSELKAPFDGYVETIFQKEGEIASPGRQVLLLVNLTQLKVNADVSESYLPILKEGSPVTVSFPAFPRVQVHSDIAVVGSVINPSNRTVRIQVKIPNEDKLLKPNIIANVKFMVKSVDSALVVPSIIIKNDASLRSFVYVMQEKDGKTWARKRYIVPGDSYGNSTVVASGLKPGDKVIYQGYNLVKNGSLVHEK